MKFFNTHISTEHLADIADGERELSSDVEQHLRTCSDCSEELASLETAIGLMRRDESAGPPSAALEFAHNIFRARQSSFVRQPKSFANKIAGTLKIDLSALTPLFGERSSAAANASNERQMLFAAGDYDLDLRIKKTENGFSINGQVLGELEEKCLIRLEGAYFTVDSPVNEDGFFSFSPLSSIDDLQASLVFDR